nr:MAG TPA: hypothetical protein [Caudoviricetes sp.]
MNSFSCFPPAKAGSILFCIVSYWKANPPPLCATM